MSIRLPALPALVAGRALKADTVVAAQRALDEANRLLQGFEVALSLLDDLPDLARPALVEALRHRLAAADRRARASQDRLEEVTGFCGSLRSAASPVEMIEVPAALFEMLSPYLDEAMRPVLQTLSRRAGPGCSVEMVESYFPSPSPAVPA
ncbi:hypothetical protein [Rubellimicrobium roseum]|uniref:Uncharacterized protein n=1 Tax=Rubellimicrobium roseum TaxID=687525 RepID=A0A5C4NC17_9RHOB|nr:hypothetical protein [Rubellimicrobium roseum]TNC72243.1 hypothetical protein FHG71_09365 [Rubellimicrobium roseum]